MRLLLTGAGDPGGISLAVDEKGPIKLGLHVVPLNPDHQDPPGHSEIQDKVLDYLKVALPVSELKVEQKPTLTHDGKTQTKALSALSAAYPNPPAVPGTVWSTVLGIRDGNGYGRADCPGDHAVADLFGDTTAHELGHNLAFGHLKSDHNPNASNPALTYGYKHGAFGEFDVANSEFAPGFWGNLGTVPQKKSSGTWKLTVIDPGDDDNGSHIHDFMSYGSSSNSAIPFTTEEGDWVSDVVYREMLDRMKRGVGGLSAVSAGKGRTLMATGDQANGREERLLFNAIVEDGQFEDVKLIRKSFSQFQLERAEGKAGPYSLVLLNEARNELASGSFELTQIGDATAELAQVSVPFVEGIEYLVIRRNGEMVMEQQASSDSPAVQVVEPKGNEVLEDGTQRVRWEVHDPDGDQLGVLVEYSPDGGGTWQPLALFNPGHAPEDNAIEVNVGQLEASERALIRVAATNGINTAQEQSNDFFSVRPGEIDATPADSELELSFSEETGEVTLSWDEGGGVLQRADSITGPWEQVPDATSPVTVSVDGERQFYRIGK